MDHLTDAPVANILILAGVIFLAVGIFGRIGGFIGSIFGNIEAGKNSRVLAGVLGVLLILGGAWLHEGGHKPAASTATSTPPASIATPAASTPSAGTATPSPTTAVAPEVPREAPGTKARATTPVKTIKPVTPEESTATAAHDKSPASVPPASVEDSLVGTWTNSIPAANSISRIEVTRDEIGLHAHIWDTCTAGECDVGTHRLRTSGTTATHDYMVGPRRRMGSLNPYAPAVMLLSVDISEPGTQHRWHHNWVFLKSTLSEKVRTAFARYLEKRGQKAFAMAPGGAWGDRFGSASADDATQTALHNCEERGKPGCRVILLNNDATE